MNKTTHHHNIAEEEIEMISQATICFKYDSEKVSILLK